jgi:hypothetical protein
MFNGEGETGRRYSICLDRADHHALTARLSGHFDNMNLIPGKRAARGRAHFLP